MAMRGLARAISVRSSNRSNATRSAAASSSRSRPLTPSGGGEGFSSPRLRERVGVKELVRRSARWLSDAEARRVDAVDQRFRALGRQGFSPIDRAVDVVLPHLARQLVKELDAVTVRVVDVDAVRHAVVDAPIELDTSALQEGELLEPRLA